MKDCEEKRARVDPGQKRIGDDVKKASDACGREGTTTLQNFLLETIMTTVQKIKV
jgi:hypothetical protein